MTGPDRETSSGPQVLLAIETATDAVGVAVVRADGGSAERIHEGGRAHAEQLAPLIEEVCAISGCRITDVDRIAVDIGPGLFTGLRVGVATAKALAQALGIGVIGVSSLDTLAAAASDRSGSGSGSGTGPGRPVVAVVDARRGEVFAAAYRFDRETAPDPASVRVDRPEPLAPEDLASWLAELAESAESAESDGRITVVGDGAVRYLPLLSADPRLDLSGAVSLASPPPAVLARLARHRLVGGAPAASPPDLLPDYRRAADARINWEQRAPRTPEPASPRAPAPSASPTPETGDAP